MSTFEKISPDDPRLTAYALGEMEPAERAEFEQLLKQDAAGRAFVAEINRTAHRIGVALASEEEPQPAAERLGQAAIIPRRAPGKLDGGPLAAGEVATLRRGLAKVFQFPQLYFTISGVAAACFAIGFIVWQAGYHPQPQVQYTEVDLTKFTPASASKAKEAVGTGAGLAKSSRVASADGEAGVVSLEQGETDNRFLAVTSEPHSSFPIGTDTVAYATVRRMVEGGRLPRREAVRIEELVNYFPYHYASPESLPARGGEGVTGASGKDASPLFAAHLEVASAPWSPAHRLVRIGLKGREAPKPPGSPVADEPPAIARDVRIDVEFNPGQVQSYRLIGYESRVRANELSSDEKIHAGEISGGHTVTALYEIVPVAPGIAEPVNREKSGELLMLRVSYQATDSDESRELEFPLRDAGRVFDLASADFKFAASVAAFGMILRDSPHKGDATFAHVTEWAKAGLVNDEGGYRSEFVGLVGKAERLSHN